MANPIRGSWKRLRKAGRCLTGVVGVTWVVRSWRHDDKVNVDVHVDSDWAKGPERKSTSGGMMMINGTVVKHWSRTQATRALSTAEAEYYAVVTGAAEGLGMQSMMADLGVTTHVRVWTDSNAAKSDSVEKRSQKDSTCGVEVFVAAGCDQVGESEHEANPRRTESGRPLDKGKGMVSDSNVDTRSRKNHEDDWRRQRK